MPQRVRRHPWLADPQRFAASREHAAQRLVAQRLRSACTVAAYQEQVHATGVARPLVADVVVDGGQNVWLEQIDHSLGPRLGARALGMVSAVADHHWLAPVLDILKVQTENLARTEAALEHQ